MTHKIFMTLGPSSMSEDIVKRCAEHGIYVFRINLSHTSLNAVAPAIEQIRG